MPRSLFLPVIAAAFLVSQTYAPAQAGIEQLLIENPPIPQKRPSIAAVIDRITVGAIAKPALPPSNRAISPIAGSLQSGLDALSKRDMKRALQIREGLKGGSLDRKILAWAIALSGREGVPSSEIISIARDLPDWPGQKTMIANAERAFAKEHPSANNAIAAFRSSPPSTVEGALVLAKAYLAKGERKAARRAILPIWQNEKLSEREEQKILSALGPVLRVSDHRHRMHQMFYDGRVSAGKRMGGLAKQFSLAKAWAAVLKNKSNAKPLIDAVAPASRKDIGFLFVRIEHLRRQGKYSAAASLLNNALRDANLLVDPDEWWNERRIVSREMLELGKPKLAYQIVARHSAKSAAAIAEAEFHSGWYALRFLSDKATARRHFQRVIDVTSQPISQSRGHYWMGRASDGEAAKKHYRIAAGFKGTYYGQLAASKLGVKRLNIIRPKPSDNERKRFAGREQVRAIKRLEKLGLSGRANSFYRNLGRTLNSAGELAILSARAERKGNNTLALQIGKLANARGLDVDTLTWPIGAIPRSAKPGRAGLPLAYAIARQESTFNVGARSPADARGLLQLLPGTAKAMAKQVGLKYSSRRLSTDGGYNVTLGSRYLADQLQEFNGSYILTFAAYNAGPRRAREWVARFGDPSGKSLNEVIDWVEMISFTETRNYVQRVMENYQVYKARINGGNLDITRDLTRGRR